jgi:hypothetical protein
VAELADYLDQAVGQARHQFREIRRRSPVSAGRQVVFLPVETLLCPAASFVVNHRRFGGSTTHQAPEPVPSLARLLFRPPSSVLAKMANLDGSRSHGGKWDVLAGAVFCGLNPGSFGGRRMLVAGHIKPWKESTPVERLDLRNGLAACPRHEVGKGREPPFVRMNRPAEMSAAGQHGTLASPDAAEFRRTIEPGITGHLRRWVRRGRRRYGICLMPQQRTYGESGT